MGNSNRKKKVCNVRGDESQKSRKLKLQEGFVAFGVGNYSLAERIFSEAITLDPNNKEIRINKAVSLERQGRLDDALREYDRLLELFPDYGLVWTNKACVFNIMRLCEEAIMCADKALRLNSEDSLAWAQKGFALEEQGKLKEAMECYEVNCPPQNIFHND